MNKKIVRKVLVVAKNLIKNGWTQGCYAKDANDHPIDSRSKYATNFCAAGAIHRAADDLNLSCEYSIEAKEMILSIIKNINIGDWNDRPSTTKDKVLNVFKKAIRKADYR